jgi:hypothetical protein
MVPYATPAICAQLDPYEERERDTLRNTARPRLGSPAQAGARIALAICEAGMRSPLQLEQLCYLSLWPKLSPGCGAPGDVPGVDRGAGAYPEESYGRAQGAP